MRLDTNLANVDPSLAALVPDGVSLRHILALFQAVNLVNGEQRLRRRLNDLGVTNPADLALPELIEFVKWLVQGLKSDREDPVEAPIRRPII
jgi:hypothetical protein